MMIKNIALMLPFIVSISTLCMNTEVKIDENMDNIKSDVMDMLSICNDQCSLIQDITGNCTYKCMMDYSKQKENFLTRKYTNKCAGLSFDEPWIFKTDTQDKSEDIQKTITALEKWENSNIRDCSSAHLSEYTRQIKSLERMANYDLDTANANHPIIMKVIKAKNKMRGLHIKNDESKK